MAKQILNEEFLGQINGASDREIQDLKNAILANPSLRSEFLEMEETQKIRNRFQYFLTMISNDADQQRKEEQEREKPAGYPAAYDIAAYESTSVLDEEDE